MAGFLLVGAKFLEHCLPILVATLLPDLIGCSRGTWGPIQADVFQELDALGCQRGPLAQVVVVLVLALDVDPAGQDGILLPPFGADDVAVAVLLLEFLQLSVW